MAVRVEEEVRRLDIPVDELGRVHVIERLEELVDDVLLVDLLEDARADDGVQVRLWRGGSEK